MTAAVVAGPSDDSALRFPSLPSLRVAHGELLKRQRQEGSAPEFQNEVEDFIRRGQATGALLDASDDRWAAQGILDYWATALFRLARRSVDTTLDEFDPKLAPELADEDCPYVGLDAFRESTFTHFFGRERLVQEMLKRIEDERLLAVVGDSGSGKSSLVLAGLLPKLKAGALPGSEGWRYPPPIVPGSEPLVNLARAVLPVGTEASEITFHAARLLEDPRHLVEMVARVDGRPCVLVIDQFEELFTLCGDPAVRRAFVDSLAALVQIPAPRNTVVLTLRSDYESRVVPFEDFLPLFQRAQVRVTPLSSAELREAIEKPAAIAGLKFEEGVVDALLRDILGEPAGLPLLQFTLLKLWQGRERNRVTWEAYRRLGGGRLALARSADTFYEALLPEEQVTAQRILLRMVRLSEGLEVTSSRVRRESFLEVEDPRRVERVLDKLVKARLVRLTEGATAADAQVEVAHEALVRNWPRLVKWLEEERAEINTRRRLETLVEEWLRLEKKGGLLDAAQLADADRWLNSASAKILGYHPELPALAEASREAVKQDEQRRQRQEHDRDRLVQEMAEREEEKSRSIRIFRRLTRALTALLIVAVGVAGFAFKAQRDGERARTQAVQLAASSDKLRWEADRLARHTEEMWLRSQRLLGLAAKQEAQGRRSYVKLSIANQCPETLDVAIRYRDLDQQWVTRGWWTVEPAQTVLTDAFPTDENVYFYATNSSMTRFWDGSGREGSVEKVIFDGKFDYLDGDDSVYRNPRKVSFFKDKILAEWTDYLYTFRCG